MDDDAVRDRITLDALEKIEQFGWMVQGVAGGADEPSFCYTVGLTPHGLPELVVFGLPYSVSVHVLNDLANRLVNGSQEVPPPGSAVSELLADGYDPVVVEVDDSSEHLLLANRLYGVDGPVAALQLVVPDPAYRFPWDPGYDMPGQPVIGRRG
ncbi:DUF4262 domain-containing protein [Angustibacter peucedani]